VPDRIVDVAIRILSLQSPDVAVVIEGDAHVFLDSIEQPREDGVLADVFGDVLFGVVSAHLLLVDVLLEDVAEDVRVDLSVVTQWPIV
jgi:hypothetical protein